MEHLEVVMLALFNATVENIVEQYERGKYKEIIEKYPEQQQAILIAQEELNQVWISVGKRKDSIFSFKRALNKWYSTQMEIISLYRRQKDVK